MKVTITRIERDAFKEAARLEKAKRHPGRGIFDKVFTKEHGKAMIFSPSKIQLATELQGQKQRDKEEATAQKELKRAQKERLKEDRERLTAQRRRGSPSKRDDKGNDCRGA